MKDTEEKKAVPEQNAELLPDRELDEIAGGASMDYIRKILKQDVPDTESSDEE